MQRTPGTPALRAILTQSRIPEILAKTVPPHGAKRLQSTLFSFLLETGGQVRRHQGFPGGGCWGETTGQGTQWPNSFSRPSRWTTQNWPPQDLSQLPARPALSLLCHPGQVKRPCPREQVRRRKLNTNESDPSHPAKRSHWECMEVHRKKQKVPTANHHCFKRD